MKIFMDLKKVVKLPVVLKKVLPIFNCDTKMGLHLGSLWIFRVPNWEF